MGGEVNRIPVKGSYQEPQEKKGLNLPVIVQKECWIFLSLSEYTKDSRFKGWEFPFVSYTNVCLNCNYLCYISSLFIENIEFIGLGFKVQNWKLEDTKFLAQSQHIFQGSHVGDLNSICRTARVHLLFLVT